MTWLFKQVNIIYYISSDQKYALKKTSVSLTKNETKVHTYPSVTICHVMPGKKNVVSDLLNEGIPVHTYGSAIFKDFHCTFC